jgi:hypothetical protein
MLKRTALLVAAVTTLALLLFTPDAHGGTYTVRQCHNSAPQNTQHQGTVVANAPGGNPYAVYSDEAFCTSSLSANSIGVATNEPALEDESAAIRFTAPFGAHIAGVAVDARLRSEQGHRARLSLRNYAGVERLRMAAGGSGASEFADRTWTAASPNTGFASFEVALVCDQDTQQGCDIDGAGANAHAAIRDLAVRIHDPVAPIVEMDGSIFGPEWVVGESDLSAEAVDLGGGMTSFHISVNGQSITGSGAETCQTIAGTNDSRVVVPCPSTTTRDAPVDTKLAPFRDGENDISVCAVDFGAKPNRTCLEEKVWVDNTPPSAAFRNDQIGDDPELIRASVGDSASGLAPRSGLIEFRPLAGGDWRSLATELTNGELRARVDSLDYPPGRYEFRASVSDVAGHRTVTQQRADGSPMTLAFPLKAPARLEAQLGNGADDQLVPYRSPGEVSGVLTDPAGDPIQGQEVTVTETFSEGSLVDRRVRTVTTDAKGRFASKLPGGPSRDVAVEYGGSRRFIGARESGIDFDVRGAATLTVSKRKVRAGSSVNFGGKVKRYFAQIPKGGKLVEVQAKSGSEWITLKQAIGTDEKGNVDLSHRFRRFYTQPVTFTFRLKVTPETDWPYRGAATSPRRKVTVVPR